MVRKTERLFELRSAVVQTTAKNRATTPDTYAECMKVRVLQRSWQAWRRHVVPRVAALASPERRARPTHAMRHFCLRICGVAATTPAFTTRFCRIVRNSMPSVVSRGVDHAPSRPAYHRRHAAWRLCHE